MSSAKLLLLILTVCGLNISAIISTSSCSTPGGCVPISSCQVLYSLFRKRPVTSAVADYVTKFLCDSEDENEEEKVCCPMESELNKNSQFGGSSVSVNLTHTCPSSEGCIQLSHCQALYSLFQKRPVTQAVADHVKKFICGFEGVRNSEPTVCCPPEPNRPMTDANSLPETDVCGIITSAQEGLLLQGHQNQDQFPWLGLLLYTSLNKKISRFQCKSALISSRHVLTAAHCVTAKSAEWQLVSVQLGLRNGATGLSYVVAEISETHVHENYMPVENTPYKRAYNDLAILKLKNRIQSEFITPICLSTPTILQQAYSKNLVVAIGFPNNVGGLKNIKLPLVEFQTCESRYDRYNISLKLGQICAGARGRDTCKGDSGGPLMSKYQDKHGNVNWYLVGIVSFGHIQCGNNDVPGVYNNIKQYVHWIFKKINP